MVVSLKHFINTITYQSEENRNKKRSNKKIYSLFYPVFIFYFHNFFLILHSSYNGR